jgi:uncharacterized protein
VKILRILLSAGRKPVSSIRYIFNLLIFLTLSLLVIGGGVLFYVVDRAVIRDIAPATSTVPVPSDLPFSVQSVSFSGAGGIRMAGWYVPLRNHVVIILLHGYGLNRLAMRWHAEKLVAEGYGVFLYDERGSGESGGAQRSRGWEDLDDFDRALDFLARQDAGENRIGLLGSSMGAQIGLLSAARNPAVEAVIADGPGINTVEDIVLPKNWMGPVFYLANLLYDHLLSMQTGLPIPSGILSSIGEITPRPILLIAGGAEVPPFGSEAPTIQKYAEYGGPNAEIWIIPEATHTGGPAARPEEYAERMIRFFNKAFGISKS